MEHFFIFRLSYKYYIFLCKTKMMSFRSGYDIVGMEELSHDIYEEVQIEQID
jgi:hypothetical protein